MSADTDRRSDARSRIVAVAADLLRQEGPGAVTTRGVAEGAGVQAPTIYRIFGDKDGLLDAVAEHVMATYVSAKARSAAQAAAADADPLEELRAGWRMQIDFALANPAVFRLLSDPDRTVDSPAARSGREVLAGRVHRVAAHGGLRVSERRAVDLIHAAGLGAIQTMLATPVGERDPQLPDAMLDAVLAQILTDSPDHATHGPVEAAVALRATAAHLDVLTSSERGLLADWLDRVISALSTSPPPAAARRRSSRAKR